jgi:hypothetical protein
MPFQEQLKCKMDETNNQTLVLLPEKNIEME